MTTTITAAPVSVLPVYCEDSVDRDTMEVGTLYVEPDGQCWYTPDGIGTIWLFEDDEQTIPMGEDTAVDECFDAERVVHLTEPTVLD